MDTTLEPLAGLELRAFRAADVDPASGGAAYSLTADSWSAVTNADGLARFELPALDPLWVAAIDEAGGSIDRLLQPMNSPGAVLEMLLPEPASVTGAFDTSEPANWTLSLAHPEPQDLESVTKFLRRFRYRFAPYDHRLSLDEEGGFGPVRVFPGEWKFLLVPASSSEPAWLPYRNQLLPTTAAHSIAPGSDFHLDGGDPNALRGKLEVEAQLDGQPARGLKVRAYEISSSMEGWTFTLDGAGRADLELPAGTYVLKFSTSSGLGSAKAQLRAEPPETFTVVGGQSKLAVCQLETARRDLWIRHADGSPLGDEEFVWLVPADAPEEDPTLPWWDEPRNPGPIEHWLHLGTWRLLIDGEPKAEFEWQPGEGPLIVEF